MQLDNRTPYEVAWLPGRLRYPAHSLTFIVKATYDLVSGGVVRVAEEQIGIGGDEDHPGDGLASLHYESDLVHHKPQADRLLVGRCHAPGGKPTVACQVSFTVGSWSRSLHVMGDRVWKRQMLKRTPSSPEPFTSMDLCYENAFGGPEYAPNPMGKGFQRAGGASDDRVHNIEDPGQPVKSQSDRPVPAGFAPISRTWWPRKDYIGTYGKPWFKTRCPWFPEDMDWKVANAAPIPSLVPGYLEGNEPIQLLNLHKTVPLFDARLPGERLRCLVERWGKNGAGGYEEPQMRLDTLWIDAENEKLILVWRGDCDVVSDEFEDLKHLHVITEPLERRASTRDQLVAAVLAPRPSVESSSDGTADSGSGSAVKTATGSGFDSGAAPGTAGADPSAARAEGAGAATPSAVGADAMDTSAGDPQNAAASASVAEGSDDDLDTAPPAATTTPVQDLRVTLESIPPSPEASPEQEEVRQEILALIAEWERPEPAADPIVAAPMSETPWTRERVLEAIEAGVSLGGTDLAGLDLSHVAFQGCSLARARLREANLTSAVLDGCDLENADLERVRGGGASFVEAVLSGAALGGAELRRALLTGAQLGEANLSGAQLSEANLDGSVLSDANLEGASLEGAQALGADFSGARLDGLIATEADFTGASFAGASLNGARFERTNLSGAGFGEVKAHRIDMTGADLAEAEFLSAELTEGNFRWIRGEASQWIGCELTKANFFEADLDGADFSKSTMVGCNFSAVSFRGGILRRANLEKASLVRSDLFEALLPAARLVGTDLRGANLFAADLSDAVMSQLEVAGANLKRTRLES